MEPNIISVPMIESGFLAFLFVFLVVFVGFRLVVRVWDLVGI